MRKLLNTLFVINEDAYLTLDGENLVVTRNKQETHRYALHTLEGIVCFTYAGASPALMGACARRGIDLCFFDPYGRFQARTVGENAAMCCCVRRSTACRMTRPRAVAMPGALSLVKCITHAGCWNAQPAIIPSVSRSKN